MRRWWDRILLLGIIGLTAFSFITVWPSEPKRYLPNFIPWPEGRGITLTIPKIEGGTFGLATIHRREMSLGLDLRGGTRLVLAPEEGVQVEDLNAALDGARDVIERRINEFGVAESEVNKLSNGRLDVQLPGISAAEAIDKIGRTALLQFCEPITNSSGAVATINGDGKVKYQPQSCLAERDAQGNIVFEGGTAGATSVQYVPWSPSGVSNPGPDRIIWQPASANIEGVVKTLTGEYLKPNTYVTASPITGVPLLVFEWTGEGAKVSEAVTKRLSENKLPLAPYLDGQPILDSNGLPIAPNVQSIITNTGQITGLDIKEGRDLSKLLNTGAFPIPLRVIQQQDVDATLGESAVKNSVIAGEVALLVIMAFMIIYYRAPGVMASLALVVYTSAVLMIFKLWPVTLTLAGIAAFILSVGMAVDANILIFERMKEELRVGRALRAALDDGFSRAWSSIRDSNISTLITCAILYWFGNQFGETAIKGFALTLAIGVVISMFSAITVSRTFMHLIIGLRPVSRRVWLFAADLPDDVRHARRVPAMAGGSDSEPRGAPGRGRRGER